MNPRRLAALLLAAAILAPAAPASAGGRIDTYCVQVAGYTICTPPLPI